MIHANKLQNNKQKMKRK